MIGHQPLVAMRLAGRRPEFGVSIETDATPSAYPAGWAEFARRWKIAPAQAHVHIGPAEHVPRLDLRFCVGLDVRVEGMISSRVRAVFEVCKLAGARRVTGHVFIPRGPETAELVELMDSRGAATWQA